MTTLRVPDDLSAWQIGLSPAAPVVMPPKDPHDDDSESGEDEKDDADNDEEEEPAVIREPDEC